MTVRMLVKLVVSDLFFDHGAAHRAFDYSGPLSMGGADLNTAAADFLYSLERLGVTQTDHGFTAETLAQDYIDRL
jgi:hypothetical protein